jgi:hypothetical protein
VSDFQQEQEKVIAESLEHLRSHRHLFSKLDAATLVGYLSIYRERLEKWQSSPSEVVTRFLVQNKR